MREKEKKKKKTQNLGVSTQQGLPRKNKKEGNGARLFRIMADWELLPQIVKAHMD